MKSFIFVFAGLVTLLVLIYSLGLSDRFFLYFPSPLETRDWKTLSGLPLEVHDFKTIDGKTLNGWLIPHPQSPVTVLYLHGNAGNISDRLEKIALLWKQGLSIFIFDWRGYGASTGHPTEEGLYLDASAAYRCLREDLKVPREKLILFGESLGTAVAGKTASDFKTAGVILEAPFPSVEDVAKEYFGGWPMQYLVQGRYPLAKFLEKVYVPVMVIHGDRDEVIPIQLGRKVFEKAREPKQSLVIVGGGHNDLAFAGGEEYARAIRKFIDKCLLLNPNHPARN